MSTAHVEIWLRNSKGSLLKTCRRADLVIHDLAGEYLFKTYPKVIEDLKKRYGKPAFVRSVSSFPLIIDQAGKTLSFTVTGEATETLTFAGSTLTLADVYAQMAAFFKTVEVTLEQDMIKVQSVKCGPDITLTIGGDATIYWGPITQGSGWLIKTHDFQGAERILIYPGNGEYFNHIELEIPPCAWKIWARLCFGKNEETHAVLKKFKGSCCYGVDLMLPEVEVCSAQAIYPVMERIVDKQYLDNDLERVATMRGMARVAGLSKSTIIAQLNFRLVEAQELGDTTQEALIQSLIALAEQITEYC